MAVYSFQLPDIGEGIAQAEIVAWHVKVGDLVNEDDPLADMMTDKATVEISSPVSGRIARLAGEIGDLVAIGSILAEIEIETGDRPAAALPSDIEAAPVRDPVDIHPEVATSSIDETDPITPDRTGASKRDIRGRVSASPAVRRRAMDLGIDLAQVAAEGHVRHGDLDAYLAYNAPFRPIGGECADEQIRVVGLRRRIAENMAAAKRNIPHFSYIEEIDVTKLEEMRHDLNAGRRDRPKLTILPLFIVALCKAVREFPMLNARYDDEAGVVTRCGAIHLGIATQTPAGLLVPVIRDAQNRNLWQVAAEIRRLAESARSGNATSAELSGSTLTITSLGPLGGIATTPVINRPEVAIIGPNKVVERPVIRNGEVAAAKIMNLSISCDHRVVDGWDAASFVQRLKQFLEAPASLFADG
jgi:2-oxoisovalerate dehydrogenase E2 component (dihydrolipoyl transacylase)